MSCVVACCGYYSGRRVWLCEVEAEYIVVSMGRFFFVESKSFEFIIEPWGNSFRVRIVERGKGYL